MSNLKLHSIEGKGDLTKECVWLDVLEDVASLSHYLVCDTTYLDPAHISNELRHMYWFKNKSVKKGDWLKVMTKKGVDATASNDRGTTTHIFYWKLDRTVWNKDGDAAVLFNINTWNTLRSTG